MSETEVPVKQATPNETVIDAQMSVCLFCGQPIASIMGTPWLHADSQAAECSLDPRLESPDTWTTNEE